MSTNQQNRRSNPAGFVVLIALWLLLVLMFVIRQYYFSALCFLYALIALVIRRLLPNLNIRLSAAAKWILLIVGAVLLLTQIRFSDYYPYAQICCAAFVLLGIWNLWFSGKNTSPLSKS